MSPNGNGVTAAEVSAEDIMDACGFPYLTKQSTTTEIAETLHQLKAAAAGMDGIPKALLRTTAVSRLRSLKVDSPARLV